MNITELAMNRIKIYQAHNNSSKFMKLSLMNFHKQATVIDPTIQVHYSPYELHELSHEHH